MKLKGKYSSRQKKKPLIKGIFIKMVGTMGFEPMTSCSQSKRATKLRNIPK
jgi:hypothetical protein